MSNLTENQFYRPEFIALAGNLSIQLQELNKLRPHIRYELHVIAHEFNLTGAWPNKIEPDELAVAFYAVEPSGPEAGKIILRLMMFEKIQNWKEAYTYLLRFWLMTLGQSLDEKVNNDQLNKIRDQS